MTQVHYTHEVSFESFEVADERRALQAAAVVDRPLCQCEGGEFVHPRHVTVSGPDMVTGINHAAYDLSLVGKRSDWTQA